MPGESLSFNITADDRASSKFRDVGRAALDSSVKMDVAAASLKLWNDTAAKQGKAATTSLNAMKAHTAATKLLADAENVLAGKATVTTKLLADQGRKLDDAAKHADNAASGFSALAGAGGAGGGGMGALIGVGVALSPVLLTLGTGLGGLALAAVAAGKNSKLLAQEMAPLKAQFVAFQKDVQPVVVSDFAAAARLAGHVLGDIEPVTIATGKALGGLFAQVDAEFRSQTWQQFFGFMAKNAAPDMQLLGKNLTDLLQLIPPLAQDMQPLARGLLLVSDDAAKAAGGIVAFYSSFQKNVPVSNQHTVNFLRDLDRWTVDLTNHIPGAKAVNDWLTGVQHSATGAAGAQQHLSKTTTSATASLQQQAKQLNITAAGFENALTPLENYISAQITERNDLVTLNQDLKKSHDAIGLKTAAERASFGAAETYIQDTLKQGNAALAAHKGIDAQIRSIENALPVLERVKGKTADYKNELDLLKGILDKLRAEKLIQEQIKVFGSGNWHVVGAPHGVPGVGGKLPFAAGGRVPGSGSGDTVPAMLTPGEAVVPKRLVPTVAPFLSAGGVPGFADGGIVGSYSGSPAGLPPWVRHNWGATVSSLTASIASSMASAFARTIQSAALTGGGGAVSGGAVEALARRMFPWPGYMWTDFTLVENREAGWNIHARNPSSGAYGLAQFINGPGEYYQYGGNPNTAAGQLTGMFNYIRQRYGNPLAAWGHELSYGWYDKGGWLKPGLNLAYNGTGRPEMVTPSGGRGAGTTVINNINVQVGHGTHPVAAAQELAKLLNTGAKAGVRLRTSILGPG